MSREEIQALVRAEWDRIYSKGYQLLYFQTDRPLTKEETGFVVTNFLSVTGGPCGPDHAVSTDLRNLAFHAFDSGRLWPYDSYVRKLRAWQRGPYCLLPQYLPENRPWNVNHQN